MIWTYIINAHQIQKIVKYILKNRRKYIIISWRYHGVSWMQNIVYSNAMIKYFIQSRKRVKTSNERIDQYTGVHATFLFIWENNVLARELSSELLIILSSSTFYHNEIGSWKYFHVSQGIIVKIFQKNSNNGII